MLTAYSAQGISSHSQAYKILDLIREEALEGRSVLVISETKFNPYKNERLFENLGYKVNYFEDDETHEPMVEISW